MSLLRLVSIASISLTGACSPGSDVDPTPPPQPTAVTSARPPARVEGVDEAVVLSALLRHYVGDSGAPLPTAVVARTVNGGGAHFPITLAYLTDRDACGSGGCTLLVGAPNSDRTVLLGRVTVTRPPIRVLTTRTNGMPDLAVTVCGGGIIECYEAVLPFDGSRYPSNPTMPPARKLESATDGEVIISEELVRLTFAGEQ